MESIFDRRDMDYQKWIRENKDGFVLNVQRNISSQYMVLHKANCRKIYEYNRMSRPGGFTERQYIKVCGKDLEELHGWAARNGSLGGRFSKACSFCKPI